MLLKKYFNFLLWEMSNVYKSRESTMKFHVPSIPVNIYQFMTDLVSSLSVLF